jgi:hypothetical protein
MKNLLETWDQYINEIEIDKTRFQINELCDSRAPACNCRGLL